MPAAPRHLAPRRSGRERLVIGLGATSVVMLLLAASTLGYYYQRFASIARYEVRINQAAAGEPRNYLLVGSDSREGLDPDDPANDPFFDPDLVIGGQRTDTIMVLRVDPEAETAHLLSFPRDLWVPIAGTGTKNRINSAFSISRDTLIDTIREDFGIPIHHYIEVDFVGFLGLVDAIDGVDFFFEQRLRDGHSGLLVNETGCVTLESRQALSFARSRYLEYFDEDDGRWRTDPSGDLGRISRQQELIRRAIGKAVSKGLTNPLTLNELVNVAVDNVALDPTLGVDDLLGLGRRFAAFNPETLKTYSLPVRDFRTSGGAAVLSLNESAAEPIFNIFRGLPPDEVRPELVEVEVRSGSGVPSEGQDVTAALARIGFDTKPPAVTVDTFSATSIYYAPGSEKAAIRLARHVYGEVLFGIDERLAPNSVVLVTGTDFESVHDQPSPETPQLPTTTTTTVVDDAPAATVAPVPTTTTTAPVGYVPGNEGAPVCG